MASSRHTYKPTWQDRALRFDAPLSDLRPRLGEFEIDSINSVEDSKGNNGDRGFLVVTNLRLIWASHKRPKTNLSIGLNSIVKLSIKTANSRLRGSIQALFVMCKYQKSRYEFIFTSLVRKSPRLFTTAQAVFRAYETTRLYRDLKLRGALLHNKQLVLLPLENVYEKVNGVWNLSSDQGNLGTFFITNIRVVWHANLAENFNVSIPFLQMSRLIIRSSKFGKALVVHTHKNAGGYILGFRLDPPELLEKIFQEIKALRKVFASKPIYGVEFKVESAQLDKSNLEQFRVQRVEDELEIIEDDSPSMNHTNSGSRTNTYGVGVGGDASQNDRGGPIFNADLGLAMEPMGEDVGMRELWQLYA
jgi:Bardet-Biedl syndrome 5 protein